MKRVLVAAVAAMPVALTLAGAADAATVLSYASAPAAQLSATTAGTGVTGSALTRGPGLTSVGGTFASTGYNFSSEAAAWAGGDYLSFSFTSVDPYDLTSLHLGYSRTGQGPMQLGVGVSVNGGAYQSLFTDASILSSGETSSIDLTALTGVTQATFYLSGWYNSTPSASQVNTGQFRLENLLGSDGLAVSLQGDVKSPAVETPAPVPLPAALPLLAAALGAVGLVGRRRRS